MYEKDCGIIETATANIWFNIFPAQPSCIDFIRVLAIREVVETIVDFCVCREMGQKGVELGLLLCSYLYHSRNNRTGSWIGRWCDMKMTNIEKIEGSLKEIIAILVRSRCKERKISYSGVLISNAL